MIYSPYIGTIVQATKGNSHQETTQNFREYYKGIHFNIKSLNWDFTMGKGDMNVGLIYLAPPPLAKIQ